MTINATKGRSETVIIGDNDSPGRKGAEKLAQSLALRCPRVKIVYPPEEIKDLRQWTTLGLKQEELRVAMDKALPIKTNINFTTRNNGKL
jgi:hypothetical protein